MHVNREGDRRAPAFPARDPARCRPRAPAILLALSDADRPSSALRYASSVARRFGADLHLLRLLPRLGPLPRLASGQFDAVAARRRIEQFVKACRQVRSWCDTVLDESLPTRQLRIRSGEFIEEATARAAELKARLIVLSPSMGRLGATATALAQAAMRPVLVARGGDSRGALVAATDLEDPEYRVVRRATEWGALFDAPVVAVHNVSCLSSPLGALSTPCVRPAPELPSHVAVALPGSLDMVVTTDLDPVEAILDQALRRQSRMIVVGARRRSGQVPRPRVPAEIVDRARCSVLVTSLES